MRKPRIIEPIPEGAIAADLSKQVPISTYGGPKTYYLDERFVCVDCGADQVWTASQQKWYYEVAKGSLHGKAVRCLECRRKRTEFYRRGDPYPVKHRGTLMKRLFSAIDPILVKAGFQSGQMVGKHFAKTGRIEFSSPNEIVVLSYQGPKFCYSEAGIAWSHLGLDRNPRLVAESVHERTGYQLLARVDLTSTTDILDQMKIFTSAIEQHFTINREINSSPQRDQAEG